MGVHAHCRTGTGIRTRARTAPGCDGALGARETRHATRRRLHSLPHQPSAAAQASTPREAAPGAGGTTNEARTGVAHTETFMALARAGERDCSGRKPRRRGFRGCGDAPGTYRLSLSRVLQRVTQ